MKLSVIVPVYNLERYIAAALDSLLDIDFPFPYEIVVVNDGSTDGSRAIIEAYQKKTERIRLLNIENKGVSNARNVALANAAGEYVAFVDGDDAVEQDFFKIAVRELDEGGYDLVQGSFRIISNGKAELVQKNTEDLVISEREKMLSCFFGPDKCIYNSVWGKVFRTETAKGVSFDTAIRIAEDQKYVFDVLLTANKIKLLSVPAYDYYIRSASAMRSLDRNKAGDILSVLGYCYEKTEDEAVRARIMAERLDILLFVYNDTVLSGGDARGARGEILRCGAERKALGGKTALKIFLLRRCRPLYDLLLRRSRA